MAVISGGYTQHPGDGAVLYTPLEYEQARRRPGPERPPLPQPGDVVFYRHVERGPLVRALVVSVQSLEDFEDANLWYWQTDVNGQPVLTASGARILKQAFDPWPLLLLQLQEPVAGRVSLPAGAAVETREARMRDSCGWLPLDYETRPQPAPPAFIVVRNED